MKKIYTDYDKSACFKYCNYFYFTTLYTNQDMNNVRIC